MNLDVIAAVLLVVVLAWLLVFLWGLVRGYARRGGWWRAGRIAGAAAIALLIRAAGYRGPISVRPPYGKKLLSLPWELRAGERVTVMWDLEPDSLEGIRDDAQAMTRYVVDNVRPGSIVLLHPWAEGNAATRRALPAILAALEASGYSFVTVSELLALR